MPRSREKEWPSTHEVRNAGVDVDREVHQQAHHQPAENAEADENAQKLWHKAERRLVDGGRGLHHAQQHADGERGDDDGGRDQHQYPRSEEHTSELQSLMRISYAVFCLKKKNTNITENTNKQTS